MKFIHRVGGMAGLLLLVSTFSATKAEAKVAEPDSFEAACSTEKFQRMHAEIREGVAQCQQTCQYYRVCGGGAPSNKYWENHSFSSTETVLSLKQADHD